MITWPRALVVVLFGLTLTGCATPRPDAALAPALVWPTAPDVARISFVKTISGPEDLGIGRGFLQRASDLLFGHEESSIVRPMAVVAQGDLLFVADPGAQGVHRFDAKEGRHDLIHAEGGAPLPSPVGLALGAAGEVYVSDSALAKVFVIRPGAKEAVPLALAVNLGQPTGIAVDPNDARLFVVDTRAHCVLVFSRDGTLESSFGQCGTGDGEFNYPTLIWRTPQGRLYVTDSLNFRVQSFDERGRYLSKFGGLGDGAGDLPRQKGVATDRFGHIYIVDGMLHAVQVFNEQGAFLLSLGGLGREPGEFWLPTGLFIGADDLIYVADSYNRRVQVLRYIGGPQ